MMSVVHPAYHCGPNGGHGSFCPSASRRFSCVLVLATAAAEEPSRQLLISRTCFPPCVTSSYLVDRSHRLGQVGPVDANRVGKDEKVTMGRMDAAYIRQDMLLLPAEDSQSVR